MRLIAITQRVDFNETYNEHRDALDQRWMKLFEALEFIPLIIANSKTLAQKILKHFTINGIVLTGGNDLVSYGGNAHSRDAVEKFLIDHAILHTIPVLGVCRGMQMILDYFKIPLIATEHHVKKIHEIEFQGVKRIVNSYHRLGISDVPVDFTVLARSADEIIEAVKHKSHQIYGMMWHPERAEPFEGEDLKFIRSIFTNQKSNIKYQKSKIRSQNSKTQNFR